LYVCGKPSKEAPTGGSVLVKSSTHRMQPTIDLKLTADHFDDIVTSLRNFGDRQAVSQLSGKPVTTKSQRSAAPPTYRCNASLSSNRLQVQDSGGRPIYHHFKVVSENFAGMISRVEEILTLHQPGLWHDITTL